MLGMPWPVSASATTATNTASVTATSAGHDAAAPGSPSSAASAASPSGSPLLSSRRLSVHLGIGGVKHDKDHAASQKAAATISSLAAATSFSPVAAWTADKAYASSIGPASLMPSAPAPRPLLATMPSSPRQRRSTAARRTRDNAHVTEPHHSAQEGHSLAAYLESVVVRAPAADAYGVNGDDAMWSAQLAADCTGANGGGSGSGSGYVKGIVRDSMVLLSPSGEAAPANPTVFDAVANSAVSSTATDAAMASVPGDVQRPAKMPTHASPQPPQTASAAMKRHTCNANASGDDGGRGSDNGGGATSTSPTIGRASRKRSAVRRSRSAAVSQQQQQQQDRPPASPSLTPSTPASSTDAPPPSRSRRPSVSHAIARSRSGHQALGTFTTTGAAAGAAPKTPSKLRHCVTAEDLLRLAKETERKRLRKQRQGVFQNGQHTLHIEDEFSETETIDDEAIDINDDEDDDDDDDDDDRTDDKDDAEWTDRSSGTSVSSAENSPPKSNMMAPPRHRVTFKLPLPVAPAVTRDHALAPTAAEEAASQRAGGKTRRRATVPVRRRQTLRNQLRQCQGLNVLEAAETGAGLPWQGLPLPAAAPNTWHRGLDEQVPLAALVEDPPLESVACEEMSKRDGALPLPSVPSGHMDSDRRSIRTTSSNGTDDTEDTDHSGTSSRSSLHKLESAMESGLSFFRGHGSMRGLRSGAKEAGDWSSVESRSSNSSINSDRWSGSSIDMPQPVLGASARKRPSIARMAASFFYYGKALGSMFGNGGVNRRSHDADAWVEYGVAGGTEYADTHSNSSGSSGGSFGFSMYHGKGGRTGYQLGPRDSLATLASSLPPPAVSAALPHTTRGDGQILLGVDG
ncbi:hypothetical protein THASP1DRAFT_28420 [Thamnocephalis sphaerospora]|uniref:Uncharacterized protein n=1 Tax=Thamnocephalis sphaerospora TaxID=78915 RepID=A0A4P9XW29_9FUNG|nr:hypothetical protein THASP1DRAFT_28420 [Thamnocephalis sphaerospora]|eukprot:RKP09801.1 hypothetical protein THASP1DRAFT_28420 [Thamnocephalis sphaerospora]